MTDLERPEDYSDSEWDLAKEWYARAMADIGAAAIRNAELLSPGASSDDETDEDTCPDCGGQRYASLGHDEPVCPDCDL